jgi:hypothetical protein
MNSKFDQTWIGEEAGKPLRMNAKASRSHGNSDSEILVQFAIGGQSERQPLPAAIERVNKWEFILAISLRRVITIRDADPWINS